jgi:hypothetical protein
VLSRRVTDSSVTRRHGVSSGDLQPPSRHRRRRAVTHGWYQFTPYPLLTATSHGTTCRAVAPWICRRGRLLPVAPWTGHARPCQRGSRPVHAGWLSPSAWVTDGTSPVRAGCEALSVRGVRPCPCGVSGPVRAGCEALSVRGVRRGSAEQRTGGGRGQDPRRRRLLRRIPPPPSPIFAPPPSHPPPPSTASSSLTPAPTDTMNKCHTIHI